MAGRRFSHSARSTRRPAVSGRQIPGNTRDSDLERRLKDGAEIVARACAERAAEFSRRIPGSLRVTGNLSGGIWIEAGGPKAPNAYPFDPEVPPVRHPLFGNKKHWYDQPYRPFLEEGAEIAAEAAAEEVANVIDDWARKRGFNDR